MIVGTVITNFNGKIDEAVAYLKRSLILDKPNRIIGILNSLGGDQVFIEGSYDATVLDEMGCTTEIFQSDSPLLVSLVNHVLELPYSGGLLRVSPLGCKELTTDLVEDFKYAEDMKLVKILLP